MLKRLSECTDDQLNYFLARIREIAALGDEAALIETDKIIWEIMEDQIEGGVPEEILVERSREFYTQNRFREIESSLKDMRERLKTKAVGRWDLARLETSIRLNRPEDWDGKETLLAECNAFLDEAWQALLVYTFERCAAWEFKNVSSVGSMMTELNDTVQRCSHHKPLSEKNNVKFREIKERGARFRWAKKNGDAEVAKAAGFFGKAESLRCEATALLAQDWAMVFDGEKAPETRASQ